MLYSDEKSVPHLFSQWWLSSSHTKDFPLPKAFDYLTPDEISKIRTRQLLNKEISQAAAILWESDLGPLIDLMLTFYHKRPKGRNDLQHPTPPAAFTQVLINPHIQSLNSGQKNVVQSIINNGMKNNTSLFIPSLAAGPSAAAGPSTALSPLAMGMTKGKT